MTVDTTSMPSAAALADITKSRTPAQLERKATVARENANRTEQEIAYYLDAMHKAMREDAPAAAAVQIGWVSAFSVRGDFSEPGSGDVIESPYGRGVVHRGLETAWARFQAELAPLGYRFARTVHTINTGSYDSPYEDRTNFVVEWAAPWVTTGRRP